MAGRDNRAVVPRMDWGTARQFRFAGCFGCRSVREMPCPHFYRKTWSRRAVINRWDVLGLRSRSVAGI